MSVSNVYLPCTEETWDAELYANFRNAHFNFGGEDAHVCKIDATCRNSAEVKVLATIYTSVRLRVARVSRVSWAWGDQSPEATSIDFPREEHATWKTLSTNEESTITN